MSLDKALQQIFKEGVKFKKLWENASPNSAFSPQTIQINSTGFDYIAIETLNTPYNNWDVTQMEIIGKRGAAVLQFLSAVGGSGLLGATRAITDVTDTSIKFHEGFMRYASTAGTDNMYLVPLKIYGIKLLGGGIPN